MAIISQFRKEDKTPTKDKIYHGRITMRQKAAIMLNVPDSGLDWLDEMIKKALAIEFKLRHGDYPYDI